jgi:hypothetical protein
LITAGTLGCLVATNPGNGNTYILSNNHVLADINNASPGDDILEPGPIDGGDPSDPLAQLADYEPIDFAGGANYIDAAIATLLDANDVTPDIRKIGQVAQPPTAASLYQSVRKHGRTTLHTVGVIMDLSADVRVRFGTKFAQFDNQIAISGAGGTFSDHGDSGSLIVDAVTLQPVALLFAQGSGTTFANPIDPVLKRFGASIL